MEGGGELGGCATGHACPSCMAVRACGPDPALLARPDYCRRVWSPWCIAGFRVLGQVVLGSRLQGLRQLDVPLKSGGWELE